MRTLGELVNETINEVLLGAYRTQYNALHSNVDANQTDITFEHPLAGMGDGSLLAVGTEMMYVVPNGVNQGAKTATVVRGLRGTTAVAHDALVPIEINPRFPRFVVIGAMKEDIESWPASIYRVTRHDGAAGSGVSTITVGGGNDVLHVLRMWRQNSSDVDPHWIAYNATSVVGVAGPGTVEVYTRGMSSGSAVRVEVARQFETLNWTEDTDLERDVGLGRGMAEILKWGACYKLIAGRESRRLMSEPEGDSRRAEEVPAQANIALSLQYKRFHDQALGRAIGNLRHIYGVRG